MFCKRGELISIQLALTEIHYSLFAKKIEHGFGRIIFENWNEHYEIEIM